MCLCVSIPACLSLLWHRLLRSCHFVALTPFLFFFGVFHCFLLNMPLMLLTSAPSFFGGSWCHRLWVPLFMMYMPFPYHPPPSTASLYLPMPSRCLTDVMFVASSPVHSWLIRHLVTCLRNVQRFLFPLPVMLCVRESLLSEDSMPASVQYSLKEWAVLSSFFIIVCLRPV